MLNNLTVRNKHGIHKKRWTFAAISIILCWALFPATVSGNVISTERILLRVPKPSQTVEPWWVIDPDNPQSVSGFMPALYQELQAFENVTIEYVPVGNEYLTNLSNYSKQLLDDDKIDIGLDVTFPFSMGYSYTIALLLLDNRALVAQRNEHASAGQIFEPFKTELWLVLLGAIVGGALLQSLIVSIGKKVNKKFFTLRSAGQRVATDFYSTFITFLGGGGDDADMEYCPFLRINQVGLLFLVLITTSTYTANLAAFLTKKSKVIIGPTNMEELKESIVCTSWPDENQIEIIRRFTKEVHAPPVFTSFEVGNEWAVDQLLNGGKCTAIISLVPDSNFMLNKNCDDLHQPLGIAFAPTPLYHIMLANTPKQKENFHRINNAFARILSDPKYNSLSNRFLNLEETCNSNSGDEEDGDSFVKIGIEEMLIPLLFYCCASILSLILTIMHQYRSNNNDKNHEEENHTGSEKSKVIVSDEHLQVLERLLNQLNKVNSNPSILKKNVSFVDNPYKNEEVSGTTTKKSRAVSFNSPFQIRTETTP